MKKGLLLINLGTPLKLTRLHVALFLRAFLLDPYVVTLPYLCRSLLFYLIILPLRLNKTFNAYKKIWNKRGSPLLFHSQDLASALQVKLKEKYRVALGMRYGKPAIKDALLTLATCEEIIILPLYPQYTESVTGSSINFVLKTAKSLNLRAKLKFINSFYSHKAFINALASKIKPLINHYDFVLFSYHGLPLKQVNAAGCKLICPNECDLKKNKACYRAQCFATSKLLTQQLKIPNFATSFQSRVGTLPWIEPDTSSMLTYLRHKGIKNILLVTPSFITDCLETLEEIGIRAKETWHSLGGKKFSLVASLNADNAWVEAIIKITRL